MALRPVLFVAREPDETLRTFFPILEDLKRRGRPCVVLLHHEPQPGTTERLQALSAGVRRVVLPARPPARWVPCGRGGFAAAGELLQLWRTRRLARELIEEIEPAAVVVVQDTLLLERFLVREANRRGRGTLVVQWAFTFPQAIYDRLNEIQRGRVAIGTGRRNRLGAIGSKLYQAAQRVLDVKFDLVKSYGGGEAQVFAVMGEAFREQFLAQGVRKKRIEITGHPLHDSAFVQRAALSPTSIAKTKRRHGLPKDSRIILYATQPVLWRAVLTRDELRENVQALGRAVGSLGSEFLLLLKLHPREDPSDYEGVADDSLPIRLVKEADVAELIATSEVFISSSSSTVLLAMMLDRPIVTVNFNQVPHFDYFETVGGTVHVKDIPRAATALRLALFDQPTRARLAREREAVLARYTRFDGQATQRLADLIMEL